MDRFKQITTFVQVAQRGSLSAAARHEGVAPAMVSRRIDALEARLGVKLMQRTTRRLTLTPEGATFVEDCQRVLRDMADADAAVAARGVEATGRLRLSAPAGFGRQFVAPMLARFAQSHPRVSVVLDLDDRVVDLVADGYDCAVRFGEQADSALVRIRLADSPRVIVASPSYLARHARPRRPQDLSRHACLMLAEPGTGSTGRPWTLRLDGGVGTLRLAAAAICNDGAVLHDWALAGLGLAWRSWWEVGEDVAAGRLVTVLDDHAAPPTPIYAVFMARKHLPLRLRSFVDQLKAHFDMPEVQRAMQTPPARPRGGKSHP